MNKAELVDEVADRTGLTKKSVAMTIAAMIDAIVDAVAGDEKVTLVGFGTFESRERQSREGRNPQTGEPVTIEARRVPAFSAGKMFKEKVAE